MPIVKLTLRSLAELSLMRIGSGNYAAKDDHMPLGKGDPSDGKGDWIARGQVQFQDAKWPDTGKITKATVSGNTSGSSAHGSFRGSNPGITGRRLLHAYKRDVAGTQDGYYTTNSSVVFGGTDSTGTGAATTEVSTGQGKSWSMDATEIAGAIAPKRITRKSGGSGGAAKFYGMQFRSRDEDNSARSTVISPDVVLEIWIDTSAKPSSPELVQVYGADDLTSDPVVVGSADGTSIEVEFGFRSTDAGDSAAKVELAAYSPSATDITPGEPLATTGLVSVAGKASGSGADRYRVKLTGLARRTSYRIRLRTTSVRHPQPGDWSSVEDDAAYVMTSTKPGAPLDRVLQPFTDAPHVLATLNSQDPADYITGWQGVFTYLPGGTPAWTPDKIETGGPGFRRSDVIWGGGDIPPGARLSYIDRHWNRDGVAGDWSAPITQTMYEQRGPTVSPDPGRLTTTRPTFTIANASFDGWRLWILDPGDNSIVLHDSLGTTVVNQTSVTYTIPAGVLAPGQAFDVVAATLPDGGTVYGDQSRPQRYTIAGLPTTVLSVPASFNRRVDTTTPTWLRTVTDPDGAAISAIEQEIRVAASPQGSGSLVTRYYDPTATASRTIPGGDVAYETAVDVRARATNDFAALAATTLNGALSVNATGCTLTSATGFAVGQDIVIASGTAGNTEVRQIATLVGTAVTWTEPLDHTHASGQAVTARAFGPWTPYYTLAAYQPPDVELTTPVDGDVVTRPWQLLTWAPVFHGGRALADATARIHDADGEVVWTSPGGPVLSVAIDAYALDTALEYSWDVTVTDSLGMATTSEPFTFTTAFVVPDPLPVLTADGTVDPRGVTVSWDMPTDVDFHHIEIEWQASNGSWSRIDGGPAVLGDGLPAFTGTSLLHIGARLGANAYRAAPSNGWAAAEPVSADGDLTESVLPEWMQLVDAEEILEFPADSRPRAPRHVSEVLVIPGADARVIKWGRSGGEWNLTLRLPDLPGLWAVRDRLEERAGRAGGAWIKDRFGDPGWVEVMDVSEDPAAYPVETTYSVSLQEVGYPVYSVLPEAVEEPDLAPDAVVDVDVFDFGDVEVS